MGMNDIVFSIRGKMSILKDDVASPQQVSYHIEYVRQHSSQKNRLQQGAQHTPPSMSMLTLP
jgi:hypothetical protein